MLTAKFLFVVLTCLCGITFLSCSSKKPCSHITNEMVADKMPELIRRVDTQYPLLARAAGIEGIVGVKFWIGWVGRVITAKVEKSSGSNAGFEEASIESGEKNFWIPAYSHETPIPYWSYYEVVFICRWTPVEQGKQHILEDCRQEEFQKVISDSVIEIHEIYDAPPSIKKTERVQYSGESFPKDEAGSLWLRAVIDDSGKVRYAMIVQSSLTDLELKDALVRAFYEYTFKPALYRGKAVTVQTECEIVFGRFCWKVKDAVPIGEAFPEGSTPPWR